MTSGSRSLRKRSLHRLPGPHTVTSLSRRGDQVGGGQLRLKTPFQEPVPMKSPWLMVVACMVFGMAARAADTDVEAANIAVVRAQHEAFNRGDWRAALEPYTDESKNFGRQVGRAVMYRIFEDIYTTFPDWQAQIQEIKASGDTVIVRVLTSGTHRGVGRIPVNGGLLVGVAPTNKHFEAAAIHWMKLKDGKIVDHYATRDDLAMMEQLGLSPQPKPFDWAKFAAEANKR
jgi:predicted ester cyclase